MAPPAVQVSIAWHAPEAPPEATPEAGRRRGGPSRSLRDQMMNIDPVTGLLAALCMLWQQADEWRGSCGVVQDGRHWQVALWSGSWHTPQGFDKPHM